MSSINIEQSLDRSTYILFGSSADSLLPDTPFDTPESINAFNQSLAGVGRCRRVSMLRFIYTFDKSWRVAYGKVHKFVDSHVKRALDQTAKEADPAVYKPSEIDGNAARHHYILLREMAKEIRDPIELRYQILQVFLPARNTTSIAVGNALFHLAKKPERLAGTASYGTHSWVSAIDIRSSQVFGALQTCYTGENPSTRPFWACTLYRTSR